MRGELDSSLHRTDPPSIDGIGTLRLPVVVGEKPPGEMGVRLPPVRS